MDKQEAILFEMFKTFFSVIDSVDTSKVVGVNYREGKEWFVELNLVDGNSILICNKIPPHFYYTMSEEERKLINNMDDIYMGVINANER